MNRQIINAALIVCLPLSLSLHAQKDMAPFGQQRRYVEQEDMATFGQQFQDINDAFEAQTSKMVDAEIAELIADRENLPANIRRILIPHLAEQFGNNADEVAADLLIHRFEQCLETENCLQNELRPYLKARALLRLQHQVMEIGFEAQLLSAIEQRSIESENDSLSAIDPQQEPDEITLASTSE